MNDEVVYVKNCGAQGDIKIIACDGDPTFKGIPKGYVKQPAHNGEIVVTHSESGHHHVMYAEQCDVYYKPDDLSTKYFVVKSDKGADIVHLKHGPDRHKTHRYTDKSRVYKIVRQTQVTPDGLIKLRED